MFKKGEMVVYGQTGVCYIEDIVEKTIIKNEKKLYYKLRPHFQQNDIIYAPINSDKVHIRYVMNRLQAEELIEKMPEIVAKIDQMTEEENYRDILANQNRYALAELAAKLYMKKRAANINKKKLSVSDEIYMRISEELLFGELAFVLEIPLVEVKSYIAKKLKGKGLE